MSNGDKHLRDNAIAFRADWWGNYTVQLGFFEDNGKMNGDLRKLCAEGYFNPSTYFPAQVPMRFTRSEQGQLINSALTLQLKAPSNGGLGVRIVGGRFLADGVTVDTSYYTTAQIASDWQKVAGTTASVTCAANGTIFIDGLNIAPLIPQRGDANFNSDGFVIAVIFDNAPAVDGSNTFGYKLTKFQIPCLVQLAVL